MPDIQHSLLIHSNKEKVYNAIATQEGVHNWWTVQAKIRSEIGGKAEFRFGEEYLIIVEITELVPHVKVGWKCQEGDKQWVGTNFSFELDEQNGNTTLCFGHLNWESQTEFFAHCNFQWGKYLMSLKNYCESGKGQPFIPLEPIKLPN